jgi:phosphoribosylformylglycinamidine synthase PurS subunit
MKFRAEINIMPLKAILDPQGKTVASSMENIGIPEVDHVRIGKHIHIELETANKEMAQKKVDEACRKLLANPITESYEFELFEM